MKLSKSAWVALAVCLFLVGAVVLMNLYRGATSDRQAAQTSLDNARAANPQLIKEETDSQAQLAQLKASIKQQQDQLALLQTELRQAQDALAQAKTKYPTEAASIPYDELLLGFAQANNLEVIELMATEAAAPRDGELPGFKVADYTLSVRGDVASILSLLDRIVSDPAFRSGQIEGATFNVPLPVSQAEQDELTARLRSELLAQTQASITTAQRLSFIVQGVLELLEEPCEDVPLEEMTQRVVDAMVPLFGQSVSTRLAGEIAQALQQDMVSKLIEVIAGIYGDAIGAFFTEGSPELTPRFLGVLGPELTAELQTIPPTDIPGIVQDVIRARLETTVAQRIAGLVDYSSVAPQVAAYVTERETPSATISLKVFIYQGV